MIRIFDIKKKNQKMINSDSDGLLDEYRELSNLSAEKSLLRFDSNEQGLSNTAAAKRLAENGPNIVIRDEKKSWLYFLLVSFKDQFIIVLLLLAVINFMLGDRLGSWIIVIIALISALIRFFQDYSTYKFNLLLKERLYSTAIVLRDNKETIIKTDNIVVGDIVKLNAGSIIPADLSILDCKDLFLNQSVFTGESVPVEKLSNGAPCDDIFGLQNICCMGASVVSGRATGLVVNTGFKTYLGMMGKEIDTKKESTNFEIGMKNVTKLLIRYMVGVCIFVLIVDGLIKGNFKEAILFALSVAVGITPSMLPMIVNVNLTKGTKSLAKKQTLVKRIEAIQNLGAIDVLCTDKTGTLTEDEIVLQKYIDINGRENIDIFEYAYLNSHYSTGMKNLVDRAILAYATENNKVDLVEGYKKVDEIPFDYDRRRSSVVVQKGNDYRMLSKGAVESMMSVCSSVYVDGNVLELCEENRQQIRKQEELLARSGMQVIALAEKSEYPGKNVFDIQDESEMTFIGLVGFLDPPKKGVKAVIKKLHHSGVATKILTGDNQYATESVCNQVGIDCSKVLTGAEVEKASDEELLEVIDNVSVYARLNPLQKERIVRLFKRKGHIVGYMGDGVNDAPSLHVADIGISVDTATDIAKEASDIILLKRSLGVVYDGVIEGRRVYGNIIKYMKMALSGDFGDVFSILIASIFLPFLPLLPIQMLIQDFIYDFSQIGIPYDNVDKEFLLKPKKWDIKGISRFMMVMGISSSVVDVISFIIFWFLLGYNSIDKQAYFQTAWFVTCLITELMIIINVRTAKKPFVESMPSMPLLLLTLLSIILTLIMPPLLSQISTFNFVILPGKFYLYLVGLVVIYFLIVTIVKKIYIKKYGGWL